jgi:hypothetical protein
MKGNKIIKNCDDTKTVVVSAMNKHNPTAKITLIGFFSLYMVEKLIHN